jgi:alpha-ketoglutarate-dependent taurine dioxygenase
MEKRHEWSEEDTISFDTVDVWTKLNLAHIELPTTNWTRVTGQRDNRGNPTGVFGDTELLWHSNESGQYSFSPLVALYGAEHMTTSATGFCQMTDWYEKQTQSFRSELDSLVCLHAWKPRAIEPQAEERYEITIKKNFVGFEDTVTEMPLVIQSPGGIRGLHFSDATIVGFKDMSQLEYEKLIAKMKKEIFTPEYVYDHWWDNDTGDLLLFDNSIMVHNRTIRPDLDMTTELRKRLGYRSAMDYAGLENYMPFFSGPAIDKRLQEMRLIQQISDESQIGHHRMVIKALKGEEAKQYLRRFTGDQLKVIMNLTQSIHNSGY